mmetsp:Transcript_5800/g.14113  ORF Transcript_5800/g.14113 Transcript_5800/m.14113 type:complete len:176 (+) Transcript_5800:79-606(+)
MSTNCHRTFLHFFDSSPVAARRARSAHSSLVVAGGEWPLAEPAWEPLALEKGAKSPGRGSDAATGEGLSERATDDRAGSVRSEGEVITTMMLRNIPNRSKVEDVRELLDLNGFANQYHRIHLPHDARSRCNLGYAFIDFSSAETFQLAMARLGGQRFPNSQSSKVTQVSVAYPKA